MTWKMLKVCAVSVAAVAICTSIFAADLVDNPRYQAWAKYKPGTLVKMDLNTSAAGMNMKSSITTTLKKVTPEKVILEIKTSIPILGVAPQENAKFIIEPAKVEKADIKPTNPEQMPNCKVNNKGTEDLKIGDKTYKCNWYEMEMEQEGKKFNTKYWTCDDLPDKLLKSDTKMSMGNTTMILTEFNVVK